MNFRASILKPAQSEPFQEIGSPPHRPRLPKPVWIAVLALACLPIGLLWDISHHSSIGRDTFWTPAHIIIQLGGIIPAMMFGLIALKTTFRGTAEEREGAISILFARAPLGAWVTIWGSFAMVTSAPFDDWWHNTYGLDVKIISPPHSILGLGMFAVGLGVLLFIFSAQNRAPVLSEKQMGFLCALGVGVMVTLIADFTTEFTWPNAQHGRRFYYAVCTPFPLLLVLAARAAKVKWAATIAAATYMSIFIFMIIALPLFPAQPRLAPIYHPIDHMVPPAFPLLLIVPAIALDLLVSRFSKRNGQSGEPLNYSKPQWWKDWVLALAVGAVYLAIVLAVQWPFSGFLLSEHADNFFFARSGHWPYFSTKGDWFNTFWNDQLEGLSALSLFYAFVRAFLSARLGLALGNYLHKLKR
jgi:hypothetical protein